MSDLGGIMQFSAEDAFFVNRLGIGLVSPSIGELMRDDMRPGFVVGAAGWRADGFGGPHQHERWIASWKALAGLHGMLDALRLEMPEEMRREYAAIRVDTVPGARVALAEIAAVFRHEAGADDPPQ
jgi:hypothetical protein